MLLLPDRGGLHPRQPAAVPDDRGGRRAQRPPPDGRRQRAVPAPHLRGDRGHDRLRPAPGEPAHDAPRGGRPVRHLRDPPPRPRPRLPAQRGGFHRHHRRDRRADLDLRLEPARPPPPRPDHRLRLQLHVARTPHPAADHALAHHPAGAADPHALHPEDDLAADARPLPARGHSGRGDPGAHGHPPHRDAHARQPDEGVGGRGAAHRSVLEGARQRGDPLPRPRGGLDHAGGHLPAAGHPEDPGPRHPRLRPRHRGGDPLRQGASTPRAAATSTRCSGRRGSAPSPWRRASSTASASRRTSRTSSSCTRWAPTPPARWRASWPAGVLLALLGAG